MGREAHRGDTREEQPHGGDSVGGAAPVPETPRDSRKPGGVGQRGQLGGAGQTSRSPPGVEGWVGDPQARGSLR